MAKPKIDGVDPDDIVEIIEPTEDDPHRYAIVRFQRPGIRDPRLRRVLIGE